MIAFVADVHLGNHRALAGQYVSRLNDRFRETLRIFSTACHVAKKRGAQALVVLGDLFDRDDPHPTMVSEVLQALQHGPDRAILLLGNHEMHSTQERDHALASMAGTWDGLQIDVIDSPTLVRVGDIGLCMVPYQPGNASEWLPGAVARTAMHPSDRALLCLHLGISDAETETSQPWMMGCHDQIHVDALDALISKHGLAGVAAGNWHRHMVWDGDAPIFQTGALVPTGWNNAGGDEHYGTIGLWDGTAFERLVLPGPRYVTFRSYDEWLPVAGNEQVRSRIVVPANRVSMTRERVDAEQPMGYVEVLADASTTQTRARQAAVAAQSAASDEDALIAYVGEMELPEGVTASEVVERCRAYLQRA